MFLIALLTVTGLWNILSVSHSHRVLDVMFCYFKIFKLMVRLCTIKSSSELVPVGHEVKKRSRWEGTDERKVTGIRIERRLDT